MAHVVPKRRRPNNLRLSLPKPSSPCIPIVSTSTIEDLSLDDHGNSGTLYRIQSLKDLKMEKQFQERVKIQFMRLFEEIKEAAYATSTSTDSQDEENRCLNAFKMLKIFLVDFGFLEASQISKDVRVLTKHPSKKIQACATDLLKLLKFLDKCEIRKDKKQKVYHKVSRVEKKYKNGISNSRNENIKAPDSDGVDTIDKRVSTLDKASSSPVGPSKQKIVTKTNDAIRDKLRESIIQALSMVSREAEEAIMDQVRACDPIRISVDVESVLFQKWGSFNKEARSIKVKYRSLLFNLQDPKNPDFRRRVLLGEFAPKQIVNMSTEDMASDERKKETEKIKMKHLFRGDHGQKRKATTD